RYGMRLFEGPALCDWGRALAAGGQRNRALEKFDEAIEFYRRIGAGQPWIDRAEAERAKVGPNKAAPSVKRISTDRSRDRSGVDNVFRGEGDIRTTTYKGQRLHRRDLKERSYSGESQRVVATILFIDIVSSTEHVTKLRDRGWVGLRRRFFELIRKQLASFNG